MEIIGRINGDGRPSRIAGIPGESFVCRPGRSSIAAILVADLILPNRIAPSFIEYGY